MAYTLSGVITGALITGLTSPTYTLTVDQAQDNRSKQSAVTALGGTQTGVVAHSVNAPFTVTVRRPSILKTIYSAFLNGVTGQYSKVPYNEYLTLVRKAAQVAANQWFVNEFRYTSRIAAGSETYDAINVKAGESMAIGFLSQNADGIASTVTTGIQ